MCNIAAGSLYTLEESSFLITCMVCMLFIVISHSILFSSSFVLLSIDASREDGSLGRLVNDEHKGPNCQMKQIDVDGNPHLCLFVIKDISEGEEITYDYGGDDCPWRIQVCGACGHLHT